MAQHRPPGRVVSKRVWLLLAVLALGLGLRVANLVDISDSPFFSRTVLDGRAYERWALAIAGKAEGPEVKAVTDRPFYQDPLYYYFLALIYSVFGHSYWAVYLIQLGLSVAFLLLVYDMTRRLFDWRAGIAAAAITALYKPLIFYESQIEKTALSVFLSALFLWLLVLSLRSDHPSHRLRASPYLLPGATGVALGLAVLARANMLLFAPLLPMALALKPRASSRKSRIEAAAFSVLGLLLVIAPVSIRNSLLTHEFTPTTTLAGQNLYIGNSKYNTTGLFEAPPWVRPNPEFMESDFAEYARKAAGRRLSPGQTSRFYARAAFDWAKAHPRNFAELLWRKAALFFNNFEIPDNQDIYFFARYSWVLRLPLLSFGVVFGLGVAAMILLARGLGRLSMVVFFFGYAASVIVFFVFARFRIPALPALLPFAGAMLPWLGDEIPRRPPSDGGRRGRSRTDRRRWFPPRLAGGLALALAAFAVTLHPVRSSAKEVNAALSLSNLAIYLSEEGDTARAVKTYEEALAIQPGHAEASMNLGLIMLNRNNVGRAFQLLSDAARAEPSNPLAHFNLGRYYQRQRQPDSSRVEFRRAVAFAPARVEFRFELATALLQVDSYPQALAQYDTLVQLEPDNAAVRHNLAVCLYKLGRLDEARTQLEATRSLGGPVHPRLDSLLHADRLPGP